MATNNYLLTSIVPLLKMFLEIGINNLCLTLSDLGFPNHYQSIFAEFESLLDLPVFFQHQFKMMALSECFMTRNFIETNLLKSCT